MFMFRKNMYEGCKECGFKYLSNAYKYVMRGDLSLESIDEVSDWAYCPNCEYVIDRHPLFTESLALKTNRYVDSVVSYIDDLSDRAKNALKVLMLNFSVPSYAVVLKKANFDVLDELVERGYARYFVGNRVTVTLNPGKLKLLVRVDLLTSMLHQRVFISDPYNLKLKSTVYYDQRKGRIEALPTNFTAKDRKELIELFGGKCAFTGKYVKLHVDHVIPIKLGRAGTVKENMLPIWSRINTSKRDKNVFEWYNNNAERFDVKPKLFEAAMTYIAEKNGMTLDEYRDYVYRCYGAE